MSSSPEVVRGGAGLLSWLDAVGPDLPWTAHRGLDVVDPTIEAAMAGHRLRAAVADHADGVVLVADAHGDPLAATTVAPLGLETEALGVRTAQVTDVLSLARGAERRRAARSVLDGVVEHARATDVELLVLRVDVDDVEAVAAAQAAGFTVVEVQASWVADAERARAPRSLPEGVTITAHDGDVRGLIGAADVKALAERSSQWDLSHYRSDPRVDPDGAARYYRGWVENIAAGSWCDGIFLAHRDGRVIGLMTDVADRALLDRTGVELRRTGWFATLEPGGGVGIALTQVCAASWYGPRHHRLWETQIRNRAVIRCIEIVGCARLVRSAVTFHAWPGDR